jgi:hypothetical protein
MASEIWLPAAVEQFLPDELKIVPLFLIIRILRNHFYIATIGTEDLNFTDVYELGIPGIA